MALAVLVFLLVGCSMAAYASAQTTKREPDTRVVGRQPSTAKRSQLRKGLAQASASGSPVVPDSGCLANTLPANDDGSTDSITLPFTINFFGASYSSLWVNNNGNVTFNAPMGTYTPFQITASTPPIIAPFFADIDTRGSGSSLVTYGTTTFQGRQALCVDWLQVGYYSDHTDKLNDVQLLLVERGDAAPGNFDIVFNYGSILWETGDASGGSGGTGGTSAGAGFSNGDGDPGHFFQLSGSLTNGALLDSNDQTGLVHNSQGSSIPGRYVFHISGSGAGGGGGSFSRPWPSAGYGYSFANAGLPTFLAASGLALGNVLTPAGLQQTFGDWARNVAANGQQSAAIRNLGRNTTGGLCFGLALSAGRFDDLTDPLAATPAGRSDAIWGNAGTGPSASMNLPGPTFASSSVYDTELLHLVADDFVTQFSTEVNTSLQRQHYAYGDPTSGVTSLKSQLDGVMGSGHDLYDASGQISRSTGTGFAMITLQTINPNVGHEVLAYSSELLGDGSLQIDVADNNFPGQHYAITVTPNGTWTYNAPYSGGTFQSTYSLSGAPGYHLGLLAVLPLFNPTGLHFYPNANGGLGSGSLVDLPPGVTASSPADPNGNAVDVEPVLADGAVGDSGTTLNFPSNAGSVTLTGADPSLAVRGAETYMTADTHGANGPVNVSHDEHGGSIGVSGASTDLSVARDDQVAESRGAGGLAFKPDGSINTTNDTTDTTVKLTFVSGGTLRTATLHTGAATAGGGMTFTPQQIAAAKDALTNPTKPPPGKPPSSGQPPSTWKLSFGWAKVSRNTARLHLACAQTPNAVCKVTLSLTTRLRKSRHKKAAAVGSKAISLPPGTSKEISIQLNATGRKMLAKYGKLKATLAFGGASAGAALGFPETITFKHKRPKRS